MQRYFVEPEAMTEDTVTITGDDVKHIVRVMRMKEGDEIICSDNNSKTVRCTLQLLGEEQVTAKIVEILHPHTELPISVTIAQGLPKGDKLDFIIQKGTELGATSFVPFSASRSVVKWEEKKARKKIERLEKIAKEAAEQSYRERIPTIQPAMTFSSLVEQVSSFSSCLVAYEESGKSGERSQLVQCLRNLKVGDSLLIVIGPEGGLTEQEIEQLEEAGAKLAGFGPRILRTETASLYVLSTVSYHFELMG
ncbi:16S rRNA (uracil(1498)-N(3))-methyltransferase [Halalkalibacter urbisdiaboli]|uniref:16S rRNA (uracil(1498)-N(3))-methyltransferase n=1 Tax=Halalkalibacter urbisdiaboli TaxID=1960589 RepID=UPI000B4424F2|nr:16S rRNA (uracil(1498)-N(3))-methyltransferase [Halalkalibacter urbisdiaboli]